VIATRINRIRQLLNALTAISTHRPRPIPNIGTGPDMCTKAPRAISVILKEDSHDVAFLRNYYFCIASLLRSIWTSFTAWNDFEPVYGLSYDIIMERFGAPHEI
jgi:hypothetical protein